MHRRCGGTVWPQIKGTWMRTEVNLGACYVEGTGVPQDYAQAARFYRLAADQGLARAQMSIGICYKAGRGVAQDDAEAVRWVRLAADQGFARAHDLLLHLRSIWHELYPSLSLSG
jgi:TPR repeat protein